MTKVLAIAGIAVRNAVRSKVVIILLILLLLSIFGIPLTVKGDGTVAGHVQILLKYTIGFASLILSLATIWAGCAAVSLEIDDRYLQLIVTKPVHRWQIWMGKWLGLVFMNFVLLLFCGTVSYGLLLWTVRPSVLTDKEQITLREQILTARREYHPQPVDIRNEARAKLAKAMTRGDLPANTSEDEVYKAIVRNLLTKRFSVKPGEKHTWQFPYSHAFPSQQPLLFRFRLSSSEIDFNDVTGLWKVGRTDNPYRNEHTIKSVPSRNYSFTVPTDKLNTGGDLLVEYQNINEKPVTVIFNPRDGLRLFVHEGSFEANYIRALLVLFFQLIFLAAIGVTMGSLFSMPVASFAALCLLLFIMTSGYIGSIAQSETIFAPHSHGGAVYEPTMWDAFFRVVFKGIYLVIGPLHGPNPLDQLAGGILIPWRWVGRIFLIKILLYSGILALLSGWILNKREIALHGR